MSYRPPFNDRGPDDYFGGKKEPSFKIFIPALVFLAMIAIIYFMSNY